MLCEATKSITITKRKVKKKFTQVIVEYLNRNRSLKKGLASLANKTAHPLNTKVVL